MNVAVIKFVFVSVNHNETCNVLHEVNVAGPSAVCVK